MKLDSYNDVEKLTKKLVSINSVNESEDDISNFIYDYLSSFDYFKQNKNQLFKIKTKDDVVDRTSVLCYVKGKTNKTIILMGHIDTVDIEDYGKAKEYACNPDMLPSKLQEFFDLDEEILADIKSNKYMFSRGCLDMKSGVASNLYVLNYFINHPEELDGNLVFISEADEEGGSLGILSVLDKLEELKNCENFKYVACINTDFHTPINGEDNKSVHIGTVGKLLPCFVCFGKEAHVGQVFNSFDPNLLSSLITSKISYNADLCDIENSNVSVPPVSLKQTDNKQSYTVQTALSSLVYFNYMIYNSSPKDVMDKCINIAKQSFDEAIRIVDDNYKKYCNLNKVEYNKLPWATKVYTYEEWFKYLTSQNPEFEKQMDEYATKLNRENPNEDMRMFGYKMVNKSYEYYSLKDPVIVLFFGTMFYSPVKCNDESLLNAVKDAIIEVNYEENISLQQFYPYISDMSFLCLDYSDDVIDNMLNNCPQHGYKYVYPYHKIKNISVPVINIGTYGKDGHKYTERVDKEYTFKVVPNLTYETIKNLF